MIHILYRRCRRWLHSLLQPLQSVTLLQLLWNFLRLGLDFICADLIYVGLLINWVLCFVTRHGLSFLLQPSSSHVKDFPFLRCQRSSVTDTKFSVRGFTTQLLITHRSHMLLLLRLLLQLLIFLSEFFSSSVGCVNIPFVGRSTTRAVSQQALNGKRDSAN
jgi:hypothetical protein